MKPFINEAFEKAVSDYLSSKENTDSILYNSFLTVVIRMLICIYGELDIINPYQTHNEEALDNNLMRFGAKKEEVDNLKRLMDGYFKVEKRNQSSVKRELNPYFIEVQKCLIDLFNLKRLDFDLGKNEEKNFFDLLYTPGTSNFFRISENYRQAENPYEIAEYYQEKMKIEKPSAKEPEKDLLSFDVYKLFNISIADLSKMSNDDVSKINKEIYESLDIRENAINKDYLLSEKIKQIKIRNNPVTTGNGYVDILLVMSIIVTSIMVVIIFGSLVF